MTHKRPVFDHNHSPVAQNVAPGYVLNCITFSKRLNRDFCSLALPYSDGYGSDATYEDELDERMGNMGFTRDEVRTAYGVRHRVYGRGGWVAVGRGLGPSAW